LVNNSGVCFVGNLVYKVYGLMVKPIDTSELGPIKSETMRQMTRLELLEYVNKLNIDANTKGNGDKFWTVTVLYNTIIYRDNIELFNPEMFKVYKGVFK
jgi:hypothetical protein